MTEAITSQFGYTFKDTNLLRRALTHAGANSAESNERLEFLGDRVLGLVIAQKVYELFPDEPEGALTRRLHALVRWEACARVGEAIDLWPHLILTRSETANNGGRARGAILGSAIEALIAAIYMDGGMEAGREFIERHWLPMLDDIPAEMRDPKTRLQEWAQARGTKTAPVYALVSREGPDHAPRFVMQVTVPDSAPATGEGRSKQEAEQAAAAALLAQVDQT